MLLGKDGYMTSMIIAPVRRVWFALIALLAAFSVAAPAGAAPASVPAFTPGGALNRGAAHIKATLVTESATPKPGTTSQLAIAMRPEPTWHGYWENGGDAGFGMTVRWILPKGVTVGALSYPVPQRLVISGLMNHVYEAPYALLAPLTIDASVAPGTRLPIRAKAQWLACTDRVCVPEQAELALDLIAGDGTADARAQFDAWQQALPRPIDQPGAYQRVGNRIRFAIPLPASVTLGDAHLFVADTDRVKAAAIQTLARDGDRVLVETDLATTFADNAAPIRAVLATGTERAGVREGFAVTAVPGTVPAGGLPLGNGNTRTGTGTGVFSAGLFLAALGGAIVGGLLLNLMPCVFPILSLKALSLARSGGSDPGPARREAWAYLAGAIAVTLALGIVLMILREAGSAVGWAFQLQHPASIAVLFALALALTLNLFGLFELPMLGTTHHATTARGQQREGFTTGALAAFVATPCSGPFMGAALGATLALPAWAALPIFGGLGLGLALPFVAIAYSPAIQRRLPRPGAWMVTFRRVMGVLMGLTALALIWLLARTAGPMGLAAAAAISTAIVVIARRAGRVQRAGQSARTWALVGLAVTALVAAVIAARWSAPTSTAEAASSIPGAEPWSSARVAALQAEGRPIFVDFTADWCLTCKANEAGAINRTETLRAFKDANVAILVADWTSGDPAITRELARHGRNSVPLYLWYKPGAKEPVILPQLLTPATLIERTNGSAEP